MDKGGWIEEARHTVGGGQNPFAVDEGAATEQLIADHQPDLEREVLDLGELAVDDACGDVVGRAGRRRGRSAAGVGR